MPPGIVAAGFRPLVGCDNYPGIGVLEDDGAKAVIDAVAPLKRKFPRREKIAQVLAYLRKSRHRMNYAR